MLEKKIASLYDNMKAIGTEKAETVDLVKKAEKEMKFLRGELKIKEKSLELSLMDRNELLDRQVTHLNSW